MARAIDDILGGIGAFNQGMAGYRQGRQMQRGRKLQDIQTQMAERQLQDYGQSLPEGFVRVDGKAQQDPSYFNPKAYREKASIKSEEEARAYGRFSGTSERDQILKELESLPPEEPTEVAEDPLDLEAQEAIRNGADPNLVQARLEKLRGG